MPSIIVVAETDAEADDRGGRRAFLLRERVSASDIEDPHIAAQLIERIGWALADAEVDEQAGSTSTAE